MGTIIAFLASVLGLLMDVFFRGFTAIGYPRLWICIVAFAATTRLLFLRDKINTHKAKLLSPVVNFELLSVDPDFFGKTTDKEMKVKRSLLKKEVYRKYKLSNGSGCLTMIIQYPVLVALFYVVRNPQTFVPSLEDLINTLPEVNKFLGLSLSAVPLKSLEVVGESPMILLVPLVTMVSSFLKMYPSLSLCRTVKDKIRVYSLCAFFVVLLGWFSATLPLAISLYWITNDIANKGLDTLILKILPNIKFISDVLKEHKERTVNPVVAEESDESKADDEVKNSEMVSEVENVVEDADCEVTSTETEE